MMNAIFTAFIDGTQNAQAKVVVQDIDSYERMQETIALLKILAHGKEQIATGKVRDAADVIASLRAGNRRR